jgi:hypothetical protein
MPKPEVQEVHAVLRKYCALAVHFSSVPRLDQRDHFFPEDLKHAAEHRQCALCCSVVKSGDAANNAFGTIGLIFDLSSRNSLIAVSPGDGGAVLKPDGKRDFDPKYMDFDLSAVERSIVERKGNSHNEWGIRDFIVRGLFVFSEDIVVSAPNDEFGQVDVTKDVTEVFHLFPGLRVYSFKNAGLVELHHNGPIPVSHNEIYN